MNMDESDALLLDQFSTHQDEQRVNTFAPFITEERAQKFDLLVHFVTNLNQTLMVCGPVGIGKSTLLMALKEQKAELWPMLLLPATELLSFESILAQMNRVLNHYSFEESPEGLPQQLYALEKRNQRFVLMIDDAGKLLAGLMSSLMQYAELHPCLRVVFALTDEELTLKHRTDHEIGECQIIEIPPLSLPQCAEYLQDLLKNPDNTFVQGSTKASHKIYIDNVVKDEMVKQMYKKTHGIPGKMLKELPNFLNVNAMKGSSWIIVLGIAGMITLGIGVLLWNGRGTNDPNNQAEVAFGTSETVNAALSIPGQEPVVEIEPEAGTGTAASNKTSKMPKMPDEGMSEPDYYSGYARVREKDALDEYQGNKYAGLNHEAMPEQPRVEIIPPEPPPAPIIPVQPVQIANVNEPPVTELPFAEVPDVAKTTLKEPDKLHSAPHETKVVADSKIKPDLKAAVKSSKKEPKPVLKESKEPKTSELAKRVIAKPPVVVKPKVADIKQAVIEKPVQPVAKVPAKAVEKIAVIEKPKTVVPVVETKTLASEPVKTEQAAPVKAAEDKVKTAKVTTAQKPEELVGLARLGVVMKYKSDVVKSDRDQASIKPNVATAKNVAKPEPTPQKSSTDAYTLQVMVFSQKQSLQNFMRKHGALGGNLKSITSKKDGTEHYVVLYGTFKSAAEANAAKQRLPAEFSRAYARKK